MSKTKNTLILILKQEIQQLRQGVVEMDEECLTKQLAKQKVSFVTYCQIIYNLTQRSTDLELAYSYIALCEFYVNRGFYQQAIKTLNAAQEVKETGDGYYLLGQCYYRMNKPAEAMRTFEKALKTDWIEPSREHQETSKLEIMNNLQQIIFQRALKNPEKRQACQQKLIELSYEKIKITQKFDEIVQDEKTDAYYYCLAMADLAEVYSKLELHETALEKIRTAIGMIEDEPRYSQKLLQFYLKSAELSSKLKRSSEANQTIKKAMSIIQSRQPSKQLSKVDQKFYYMHIKQTLGV